MTLTFNVHVDMNASQIQLNTLTVTVDWDVQFVRLYPRRQDEWAAVHGPDRIGKAHFHMLSAFVFWGGKPKSTLDNLVDDAKSGWQ